MLDDTEQAALALCLRARPRHHEQRHPCHQALWIRSSYRRKLIGYFEAWKQGRHSAAVGLQAFRVLTVTTSEKRISHMLAVQREITKDSLAGFFLYTTRERIADHGPLGPAWISADADAVRLLEGAETCHLPILLPPQFASCFSPTRRGVKAAPARPARIREGAPRSGCGLDTAP